MIRIAVASGKGGTGKTTVATSLALALARGRAVHLLDCDVEAPNAALFLRPAIGELERVTIPVPSIDESRCDHCGECSAFCRFHALAATPRRVLLFAEACRGCGGCALVCPKRAITEIPRSVGQIAQGAAGPIRFTQGTLNAGEIATVHLIRAVRAKESPADVVIVDSAPGASCPMVAAVEDADWVLLVTEPTPFGLHDLALAAETTARLGLRTGVVVNRDGGGDDRIDRFCASAGLPILGRIADDRRVAEVYARGDLPLFALPSFRREIEAIGHAFYGETFA
jgi:MinD superfamily P-loop ATPase